METNPESSRIVIRKRGKSRQESWSGSVSHKLVEDREAINTKLDALGRRELW
jgi:hypothetical protein